jgi:phage-related protein
MTPSVLRPVVWIGSAHKDYCEFPDEVQDDLGYRSN